MEIEQFITKDNFRPISMISIDTKFLLKYEQITFKKTLNISPTQYE